MMRPRLSTPAMARAALAVALLAAVPRFADGLRFALWPALPVVSLWGDAEAQYRLQLGEVPYALLRGADEVLPANAAVLLITPGEDVRHVDYATFHRALYFLTPRPVWWLTPAPRDGTWEARWWISAPLTPEVIRAVAAEKGATCAVVYGASLPTSVGRKVAEWEQGALFQLYEGVPCTRPPPGGSVAPVQAGAAWPVLMLLAVGVALLLGYQVLRVMSILGYRAKGVETAALAWVLGSGLLTAGMLWLTAFDVSLNGQCVVLTGAVIGAWGRIALRGRNASRVGQDAPPSRLYDVERPNLRLQAPPSSRWAVIARKAIPAVLLSFLTLQVAFVAVLAAGRPLAVWDSWVNWGMKARTIFLEGSVADAVYADPSRAVTLLDYPLLVPLLQAWVYAWLGAPDDRLAGVPAVLFYLALAVVCYAAVRRRGAAQTYALGAAVVVSSMRHVADLAAYVFPDLTLAVLATLAGIYLVEWLDGGPAGTLAIAAISAGLMPWSKREGLLLVVAICLAALVIGRGAPRRAWLAVASLALAALVLAGPWWAFIAWKGIVNDAFMPVSLANFWANLGRLPYIGWNLLNSLLSANWSFAWPLAALLAGCQSIRSRTRVAIAGSHSALLLAAPVVYLGMAGVVYIFSAFVPFQQHVVSSVYRLIAHVAPLPALWLGYRGLERR